MDKFVEFRRFSDIEKVTELTTLFEENRIEYKVVDRTLKFKIVANEDTWENRYILKIRESDFEKANGLAYDLQVNEKTEALSDHYLYTFSDEDIIDAILNPENYTHSEIILARKISDERNLVITSNTVNSIRERNKRSKEKNSVEMYKVASWFLTLAAFSYLNSVFFLFGINFRFPGIYISELIDYQMQLLFNYKSFFLIVPSIIFSSLLLLCWYLGKQNNRIAYTIGVVFYTLDTAFLIVNTSLSHAIFQLLILLILVYGLMSYKNIKIENVA